MVRRGRAWRVDHVSSVCWSGKLGVKAVDGGCEGWCCGLGVTLPAACGVIRYISPTDCPYWTFRDDPKYIEESFPSASLGWTKYS